MEGLVSQAGEEGPQPQGALNPGPLHPLPFLTCLLSSIPGKFLKMGSEER